ncbi:uncharacterized protein LOC134272241 [Saccostrea cucullata]|uniref:uncharacterized protein LOC134272241 n=1 Tax=Saccostrea cuccullata TaxID=36930 RepID=UPI002ED5568B
MAEKGECKGNTGDEVNDVKGKQLKTSTFAGISSDIFNGTDSKSGTKERQFGYEDQPLTCDPLPDLTENQRVVLYTVYLCRDDRDYIDLDDDAVSMGEIDVRKTVEELEDRGLMKRVRVSDNRSLSRIPCDKLLEIMESYMENCLLRDIDKDFFIHVISDYSLYCYIIDFFTLYRDDSSPQDSRSVTLMRLMMEGRMDVVLRTISRTYSSLTFVKLDVVKRDITCQPSTHTGI